MRTSTIATSGLCARTFRRRSSGSPAWATTSKPASSSRRTTPSRNRTESSAITTRMAGASLVDEGGYELARQVALRHEPARAAAAHERPEVGAVAARGEHDDGGRLHAGEPRRDVEPIQVGKVHVEQHELGVQLGRRLQRGGPALGLADHVEPLGLEEQAGARAERRVVVHDQDGMRHVTDSARNQGVCLYGYPYLPRAADPLSDGEYPACGRLRVPVVGDG